MQYLLTELCTLLNEPMEVGGAYVAPASRLLLQALALSLRANSILETGHDTGLTTLALAMTGAQQVIGVDNRAEHNRYKGLAEQRVQHYAAVTLVKQDALWYLLHAPNDMFDLIFIDDCHWPAYVALEIEEACRVVRPGGYLAFHDSLSLDLGATIREAMPHGWDVMEFPCIMGWPGYGGKPEVVDKDFGLMLAHRPRMSATQDPPQAHALEQCCLTVQALYLASGMQLEVRDYHMHTAIHLSGYAPLTLQDADHDACIPDILKIVRHNRIAPQREFLALQALKHFEQFMIGWGMYCAERSSLRAKERQEQGIFGTPTYAQPVLVSTQEFFT